MNRERCNEDVVAVDCTEGNTHREGVEYSHPCFGMVSVSRVTGCNSKLFGSEVEVSNTIRLNISTSEVVQDLGRNWYHTGDTLVEVSMSPNQYAELISNPNTQGSPCTIKYRQDKGTIVPRHIDTVTEFVQDKIDNTLSEYKTTSSKKLKEIQDLLNKKGNLKVADRLEVSNMIESLVSSLNSSIPFYKDSITKSIDKAKTEAKAEIDSFAAHVIHTTGIKALNDDRIVSLLLESDSPKKRKRSKQQ